MIQKNTHLILQYLGLNVNFRAMKDDRTSNDLFSKKGTLDHFDNGFDSDLYTF